MENNDINKDLNESKKICKNCNIEKSIDEYTHYTGKLCKDCYKQKTLERVRKSRVKNKKEKVVSDKKVCKQCGIEKSITDIKKDRNICFDCYNQNRRQRYENNKTNKKENNKIEENKDLKKVCKKCGLDKNTNEFHKNRNICKICWNQHMKPYYADYRKNNSTKISDNYNNWLINNKESRVKYQKDYHNNEKIRQQKKERKKQTPKEKQREYKKNWYEKYSNIPVYKLTFNIRSLIYQSFKNAGYIKESHTYEILGCSFEYLLEHIEKQFQPWMNWNNQGKYNGDFNFGWDIDHIEPLFPEGIKRSPEDIIRLNHYTNLQPLCSKINREIKRNNLNYKLKNA
jgi:hypothetical protein